MKGIKYQRYPSIVKENGNIPTKEKIRKIEQAVLDYKKALIKVGFYDSLQKLDEDQESDRAYYQAFINYFNQILNSVSKMTKEYIKNEYISRNDKHWYEKEHSRSFYFKLRSIAINEFYLFIQ